MKQIDVLPSPFRLDSMGIISWVQIGDLHMAEADGQNVADLRQIVGQLNTRFGRPGHGVSGTHLGPNKNGREWSWRTS